MRSFRCASSVLCVLWAPRPCPMAPSLIAITEIFDIDVVAEFGVPGPISLGVVGSDIGGGTA